MASLVVQAASDTSSVVKVVQPGISASATVQSTETRGTITINTATDVDSSSVPDGGLLVWNASVSRYEIRAFTDLAFDAGLM
jgi:hypothetical protein